MIIGLYLHKVALHLVQVLSQEYTRQLSLPSFADISLEACQVPLHNVAMIILQGWYGLP